VCHLDTCPVGVATQNPVLRERFSGKPEFVVNFFEFIAEEVREILAELGFRSIEEAVGHAEFIDATEAIDHWKASGLDIAPLLHVPDVDSSLHQTVPQDHGLDKALDNQLIELAEDALERGEAVRIQLPVRNVNRTVGTMLGYEVTKRYRGEGLPEGTIDITLTGSAGQSLGAFVPRGITIRLEGDANDYVGKGLSGGVVIVRPSRDASAIGADAQNHVIAGNTVGYGATSGRIHLRGKAGERFAVRNSGATLVVEGVGDHGMEYMTGGRVVILGETGRNLAAGMSGGIGYVLDLRPANVNGGMVGIEAPDAKDREWLRETVQQHYEETGSTVAAELLADWGSGVSRFSKIMPTDYKAVLAAKDAAERDGLSESETTRKMMEAAHG
jgi:glutamate synthase (NADPH/NADH) large chain